MTEAALDRIKTIGWIALIVTVGIVINTLAIVKKVDALEYDRHGAHGWTVGYPTNDNLGTYTPRKRGQAGALRGGRPAGCPPRAWCGCWLGKHLGMTKRSLWVARLWAREGTAAGGPAPGVVVVWRHHVGIVTSVPGPGRIVVLSGNDGRAVRERERSVAGVIAWRRV